MVTPRIIIHGGAGNITRDNLPPSSYALYQTALLRILSSSHDYLLGKHPDSTSPASAIDAAAYAVSLLELDGLFNCAHGAVFTKDGTNELEASIMVSRGYKKRGAAVSMLKHVKSPITLAKELLKMGEHEDNGGAQGHVHISGPEAERLAKEWGCEIVEQKYFWTRKRWEQHKGGLEGIEPPPSPPKDGDEEDDDEVRSLEGKTTMRQAMPVDKRPDGSDWPFDDPAWDGREYIPKGTVGCVVLDADGVLAVATSTGGLTNKLSGRIGDTPTFGAGFWAEEWADSLTAFQPQRDDVQATGLGATIARYVPNSPLASLTEQFSGFGLGSLKSCFASSRSTDSSPQYRLDEKRPSEPLMRGVALGGTGTY
jgi:L-asparaginase